MRVILLALLAVSSLAFGQSWGDDSVLLAQAATEQKAPPKKDPKADEKKAKPRPRVGIQKQGARGGDAPGHGGASSLGGTPGTPSGSFTTR